MITFKEYLSEGVEWHHPDDVDTPDDFIRWDFFYRLYHKSKERMLSNQNSVHVSIMLPSDTPLSDALAAAIEAGARSGSHITGIYQIQNDDGIYQQIHDRKIVPERTKKWKFQTWAEIDALDKDVRESFVLKRQMG